MVFSVFLPISQGESYSTTSEQTGEEREDWEWEQTLDSVLADLDFSSVENILNQMDEQTKTWFHGSFESAVRAYVNGELDLSIASILDILFQGIISAIKNNIVVFVEIFILGVLATFIGVLRPGGKNQGTGQTAEFLLYLLCAALILQQLFQAANIAQSTIGALARILEAVFPILLVLMTAMGGTTSSMFFSPSMAILTGGISTILQKMILPLGMMSGAIHVISGVSEKIQLTKLAVFLKKIAQWALGTVFVVFLGITALKGLGAATIDGVTIKTAKFAIDKFVPIIGGMFSDTVDTLIGCTLVVKNGMGIVSTILLTIQLISPVLSLMSLSFGFSLCAALTEPFGQKKISDCLSAVSGITTLICVCVLTLASMMLILLALMVSASNINIMMR